MPKRKRKDAVEHSQRPNPRLLYFYAPTWPHENANNSLMAKLGLYRSQMMSYLARNWGWLQTHKVGDAEAWLDRGCSSVSLTRFWRQSGFPSFQPPVRGPLTTWQLVGSWLTDQELTALRGVSVAWSHHTLRPINTDLVLFEAQVHPDYRCTGDKRLGDFLEARVGDCVERSHTTVAQWSMHCANFAARAWTVPYISVADCVVVHFVHASVKTAALLARATPEPMFTSGFTGPSTVLIQPGVCSCVWHVQDHDFRGCKTKFVFVHTKVASSDAP